MATYTGGLASNGLPELADEGEIDFPAMTLRRALHVTLRDSGGGPVIFPDPAESPGADADNPAHVTGSVEVTNRVTVRPDLGRFANGRLPVDIGLVFPDPLAPVAAQKFPKIPSAVGLFGDALDYLKSISESVVARLRARSLAGWVDLVSEQGGPLWSIGGHPEAQSYEWSFAAAQTNAVLWIGQPGIAWKVLMAKATTDADCTVNVACRVGFSGTGSLATLTSNSLTPARGTVLSEADIPPGSGIVLGGGGGIIARGGSGESLLITCDAATGGSLRVAVVMYPVPG